MFIYVVKHRAVLGISGGLMTVKYPDKTTDSFPKNNIEGISIFAKVVMTTACMEFCLMNNISVGYFSLTGRYYGRLVPLQNTNAQRLRKQVCLSEDNDFVIKIAQKIVTAKINNQLVVCHRYARNAEDISESKKLIKLSRTGAGSADSLYKLIGHEGIASKNYFEVLSRVIENDFVFVKRSRRPACDPFNCMLNLGYSILTKEIIGEIECRGLNPYIGFIHQDRSGHPALASDLIEEWRPVIVDSLVMNMIQGHEVRIDDFVIGEDGCKMREGALRLFIAKLEQRMEVRTKYLKYMDSPVSFREAVWHQADRFSRAVESGNPDKYIPVMIR